MYDHCCNRNTYHAKLTPKRKPSTLAPALSHPWFPQGTQWQNQASPVPLTKRDTRGAARQSRDPCESGARASEPVDVNGLARAEVREKIVQRLGIIRAAPYTKCSHSIGSGTWEEKVRFSGEPRASADGKLCNTFGVKFYGCGTGIA